MRFKKMSFFQKIKILLLTLMLLIGIPTTTVTAIQQKTAEEEGISMLLLPDPSNKEFFAVKLRNNLPRLITIKSVEITLELPEGVTVRNVTRVSDKGILKYDIANTNSRFAVLGIKTGIGPSGGVLGLATVETQSSDDLTDYKVYISQAKITSFNNKTITYRSSSIAPNKSTPTPTKTSTPTALAPTLDPEKQRCVALCNQRYFLCNNPDEDEKGYDYCKTFDKEKCIEECSTSTPESSPSPTPNTTPTVTPAPPAASSPTPTKTPTPTSTPKPDGNSSGNTQPQTNICKNSPRVADFNKDGKVDIADFNKMRDCLYPVNKILTEQEFLDWFNSLWKPEFLKSLK